MIREMGNRGPGGRKEVRRKKGVHCLLACSVLFTIRSSEKAPHGYYTNMQPWGSKIGKQVGKGQGIVCMWNACHIPCIAT